MKIWSWKRTWVAKHATEKAAQLQFDTVTKIAVLKHAALGDLILTRPFLLTLKHYFPNAKITLSVAKHYMNGVPYDLIDRVHVTYGKKDAMGIRHKIRNLKELGEHDIVFDISAVSRTFWISLMNKAKLKVGFKHNIIHRLIYDIAVTRTGFKFEAETFLDQLLVLGLEYQWPLEFAMQSGAPDIPGPYIVYFPTASDKYKAWDVSRFVELMTELQSRYPQHQHVLLGGIADWEKMICDKIEASITTRDNFTRINGGDKTFDIIAHASLLVSNDTGIRNLAIAYYTPTVGIFISTLPFNYAPRFGKHAIIYQINGGQPDVKEVLDAAIKILKVSNQ